MEPEKTVKRILVLSYSQSGQLTRILRSLITPLEQESDISVCFQEIKPRIPFPFPWSPGAFLNAMPESVLEIPAEMESFEYEKTCPFDLIVLGYQVWFLSPSIPVASFLQYPGSHVLLGSPVLTVIGCRGMWVMAHQKMKLRLKKAGAQPVGNLVVTESRHKLASFLTTPAWLMTGKRDALSPFLPAAGVTDQDTDFLKCAGNSIIDSLRDGHLQYLESQLKHIEKSKMDPVLLQMECLGHNVFLMWARLSRWAGDLWRPMRGFFLLCFAIWLCIAVITGFPIALLLVVFRRLLMPARHKQWMEYHGA